MKSELYNELLVERGKCRKYLKLKKKPEKD